VRHYKVRKVGTIRIVANFMVTHFTILAKYCGFVNVVVVYDSVRCLTSGP
jgi:hypothetical protein